MTTDNTNTTRNDSLAARTDTWLQSLLVWSPGQRDIIKTVALVLMVLDHANRIRHLDQSWMFLVGRGAFRGARRIRKKSYAKVFRASVRAETSRLPVCGSAARRNRRLG